MSFTHIEVFGSVRIADVVKGFRAVSEGICIDRSAKCQKDRGGIIYYHLHPQHGEWECRSFPLLRRLRE
jgi:hypothetical protein